MKKYIIIILLILVSTMIFTFCQSTDNQYSAWKDTHEVYGDGTYCSYHSTRDGKNVYGITNTECNQSIVEEIFSEEKVDEKVYVYGMFYPHKVYLIMDINKNVARYYPEMQENDILGITNINALIESGKFVLLNSYDDFTDEEKAYFEAVKNK